jgi:nitrate/TMAO reductase-like tetraheme cytochrome c subunit
MSGRARAFCERVLVFGRRVRLPLIRRPIPIWVLVLTGLPLVLLLGGTAVVVTNQPVFCASCHEMDLHYATWRQSSHRNVGCEECHVMPGMTSMFKSKLAALRLVKRHAQGSVAAAAIQGHVPDANCKRCHPESPELVTYHGLKITHKAHQTMGESCTFCHDRVVHGPKWLYTGVTSEKKQKQLTVGTAYAFTPTMETCYKCHDGKKAANECSTCHVTLGERRPSAFDPAWVQAHKQEVKRRGEEDCARCHTEDFCQNCHRSANPHRGDWIAQHPDEARTSPSGCYSCHLAPAEPRPARVQEMAFCRACHGLRVEHRDANWGQAHGREALANPAECQKCHTASWCQSCHSISRPHPEEWLARHTAEATRDPASCKVCHTQQFCERCHRSKRPPPSHTSDWLIRHKESGRAPHPGCNVCHTSDFCQRCHAQKPPASHRKLWLSEHGALSRVQRPSCDLCHEQSFCDKCHGVIMPHPDDWVKQHPKTAAKDQHVCQQCHRKEGCQTCHRGALPDSHKASQWMARHGAQAKQPDAQCTLCHRSDFCVSCHGTQMPHAVGWDGTPHAKAGRADRDMCLRCHKEADCTKCHGLQVPHPDTWLTDHGKQATSSPGKCMMCHKQGHNDCSSCHASLAPPSHQASDWKGQHGIAGANQMDLCVLCHGEDACNRCHAKRKQRG